LLINYVSHLPNRTIVEGLICRRTQRELTQLDRVMEVLG